MATEAWQDLFQDPSKKQKTGAQSTQLGQQTPLQQQTGQPLTTGQASPITGGMSQMAPQKPQQVGTGNFTNLQSIAKANVGAGQQMAQQIGQQGQQASKAAQTAQQSAIGNVGSLIGEQKGINQQAGETVKTLGDSTNVEGIGNIGQNMIDFATKGPSVYSDRASAALSKGLTSTSGLVGNVADMNTALGTEKNTASLLQNILKGTKGRQTGLDIGLLQSQGSGELAQQRSMLGNYLQNLRDSQNQLSGMSGDISSNALQAQKLKDAMIEASKKAMGTEGSTEGILGKQAGEQKAQEAADKEYLNKIVDGLGSRDTIDPKTATALGLDTRVGLWGANSDLIKNLGATTKEHGFLQKPDYQLSDFLDTKEIGALSKLQQLQGVKPEEMKYKEATKKGELGFDKDQIKSMVEGQKQKVLGDLQNKSIPIRSSAKNIQELASNSKTFLDKSTDFLNSMNANRDNALIGKRIESASEIAAKALSAGYTKQEAEDLGNKLYTAFRTIETSDPTHDDRLLAHGRAKQLLDGLKDKNTQDYAKTMEILTGYGATDPSQMVTGGTIGDKATAVGSSDPLLKARIGLPKGGPQTVNTKDTAPEVF